MVAAQDPKGPTKSSPKMEQFREQIDLYEGLYLEIEEIDLSKVFCGWFRVDLRPFRQSVLNTVCKWSNMFKTHLVDRVTTSLSDLGTFIRYFRAEHLIFNIVMLFVYDSLHNNNFNVSNIRRDNFYKNKSLFPAEFINIIFLRTLSFLCHFYKYTVRLF